MNFNNTKRRFAKLLLAQTSNTFSGDKVVRLFGRFIKQKKKGSGHQREEQVTE